MLPLRAIVLALIPSVSRGVVVRHLAHIPRGGADTHDAIRDHVWLPQVSMRGNCASSPV
jgi:hypothetical protein